MEVQVEMFTACSVNEELGCDLMIAVTGSSRSGRVIVEAKWSM